MDEFAHQYPLNHQCRTNCSYALLLYPSGTATSMLASEILPNMRDESKRYLAGMLARGTLRAVTCR